MSSHAVKANRWTPKLLLCLCQYFRQDFVADLIAGLTVGLVATTSPFRARAIEV